MLGKGPTFARRDEFPLGDFNLIGLNNVAGELQVDVAHIIDVDVVGAHRRPAVENCGVPADAAPPARRLSRRRAHAGGVLRRGAGAARARFARAGWSGTTPRTGAPVGDSPVVRVRYFSSEAAMDILGHMGVKKVRHARHRRRHPLRATSSRASTPLAQRAAELRRAVPRDRGHRPRARDRLRPAGRADARVRRRRRVPDRRRAGARAHDPQARQPPGALRPDDGRPDARSRRIPRTAGAPASRSAASTSRAWRATEGAALYMDADMQVFEDLAELWDTPWTTSKVLVHPPGRAAAGMEGQRAGSTPGAR